ncbi:FAD-dependent monooxygenase [Corynebacterium glyciniphilum]|uniref:FAD-dependent monooxygenase n=1 Tax=Corynebacterium glyciniphilum TaxID=1404244 RepID=UPI0026528453|nr:FAD-dependent monooxygenase [Corynebacterium glyciniphilum]MDN6707297.1 FAD-dependent monooxygenase [Corynebacterium glyciniphilum]
MRIAVIDAGIAGLVAAAGLQKAGHEVAVFERRSNSDAVGAGLTLFGNAFEALDLVGLGDTVRGVSSAAIASMRAGQRSPSGGWLTTAPASATGSMRSVHRQDLHRALTDSLVPGTLHTGSPATVDPSGGPHIVLDHDTARVDPVDLVIVADGIHSPNRRVLGLDTGLHYVGYTAWRGVTSEPVDIHDEAGETWGRGQIFGIVPLPDNRIYWFGTLNCPSGTIYPEEHAEVRRRFAGWHPPIQDCIAATPPGDLMRHDIYDLLTPLTSLTKRRTVLIGDAATLTVLLRGVSPSSLGAALNTYTELRHARTTSIMQRSRWAARAAQASHPLLAGLRDMALRLTPGGVLGAANRRMHRWPRPD